MRNIPNFLIVGAAKSGSTSLYKYLCQHPQIFMPINKEPNFLVADYQLKTSRNCPSYKVDRDRIIFNKNKYFDLFKNVNKNQKMIGESSVTYLYKYEEAIKNIKKYIGDPKIIIILRNPIHRAFSQYSYSCELGFENLSFKDSIKIESDRLKNNWSSTFAYIDQGMYYKQIKAYKESFSNVHFIIFEEFIKNPKNHLKNIYDFLDVDNRFENNFLKNYNKSGVPLNRSVHNFLMHDNFFKKIIRLVFMPFGMKTKLRQINRFFRNLNQVKNFRLRNDEYEILNEIYKNEISKIKNYLKLKDDVWI